MTLLGVPMSPENNPSFNDTSTFLQSFRLILLLSGSLSRDAKFVKIGEYEIEELYSSNDSMVCDRGDTLLCSRLDPFSVKILLAVCIASKAAPLTYAI
ncbi:hypothetical protein HanIR_Chr01g0040941 [Helianthus annuus]|nr:hypothetical protein HanIR_Chr01g0040941 [Helianthus annuus]